MNIVFCTTCKNRNQHLRQTLPQNLADNPKSTFVILNYNTEDDLLDYVFDEHAAEVESGRLVVYSNLVEPRFQMAHAKNMAHRCGILEGGDVLVNLDADNMTGPRFEDFVAESFEENPGIFLWANVVQGVHSSGARVVRGTSGRIAVGREAFLRAGGYDEARFNEWGADDKDLNLRLRMLGCEGVEIGAEHLLGVLHNNKMRFREYPELARKEDEYFKLYKGMVKEPVVNGGRFGCGTVYLNRDLDNPIELKPIPPRVFGIGMHKTATTSLHHAFEALGYDSWHWNSAHSAKTIWREMNNEGRSSTLEQFNAACDLPIPLLFRQIDEAYPGSKFVLTIRDDRNWLDAVRRHFDPDRNPRAAGWDDDPFSNRIHEVIYGRRDFDADTFLVRYWKHNYWVREYFQHRPRDLLVMNMDDGAGWAELCGFLGVPVPDVAYPRMNGRNGHG